MHIELTQLALEINETKATAAGISHLNNKILSYVTVFNVHLRV